MGGRNGDILQSLVDDFNKSQSKVNVELQFQGNYYLLQEKFMAAIAAGNPPTLIQLPIEGTGVFGPTGALADLSSYVDKDPKVNPDTFLDGLLADSKHQNKFLAIPFNRSTPLLYYNKDCFVKAGLNPNSPPATWEKLLEYSKKLTKKNKNGRVLTYGYSPIIHWWLVAPMIWSYGGEIADSATQQVLFNSQKVAFCLDFLSDMVNTYRVAKINAGAVFGAWDRTIQDFNQGRVAMYIGSSGDLAKITANFGATFVPRFEGHRNTVPNGGGSLFVAEKASKDKKDAAWEVISYFVSPAVQATWSRETGYMPVNKAALELPEMKKFYREKPNYKVAVDQLKYAHSIPSSENFLDVIKNFESAMQEIIISDTPASGVLKEAAQKLKK
nr:ABC transporter substrate-binding protein [Hydrogenispora ethanolica]